MEPPDTAVGLPSAAPIPTADGDPPMLRRLQAGPQTAIDVTALPAAAQATVKVIAGDEATAARDTRAGFIPVYYLPGDDTAAVELFAQLNAHRLAELDLTGPNPLTRRLPVAMYTRVLAATGRLSVTRYDEIVVERREDGTTWLIESEWYDTRPDDRHAPGRHVARIPAAVSLQTVYYTAGAVLSRTDLQAHPIEGNVGLLLWYYREVDAYDCEPAVTSDDEPVLEK